MPLEASLEPSHSDSSEEGFCRVVGGERPVSCFGVWALGFGVLGFGFWGLGFGVWGLGFGVWGLRFEL